MHLRITILLLIQSPSLQVLKIESHINSKNHQLRPRRRTASGQCVLDMLDFYSITTKMPAAEEEQDIHERASTTAIKDKDDNQQCQ